ncbi:uncharacterized protein [Choristoneura fumiferana]|uniref:uncharacterized protein n=1 Tax=Choristoneura fumiferana TaxID=7141 RepID=UPI003D15AC8C
MSFDVHPAVFATVTLFIVICAWVTFAVTCYLRRRENSATYKENDKIDDVIDLTNVVVPHSGSNFKSSDRGNDGGNSNVENGCNDTDDGATGGGDTGGSDTGGGGTGGGGSDGGDTGDCNNSGDTGGGNSEIKGD